MWPYLWTPILLDNKIFKNLAFVKNDVIKVVVVTLFFEFFVKRDWFIKFKYVWAWLTLEFLASFSFYFISTVNNVMTFLNGDLIGAMACIFIFAHVRTGLVYLEDLLL